MYDIGTVVRLKSGGMKLTITEHVTSRLYKCVGISETGVVVSINISYDCLEVVKQTQAFTKI